MRDRLDLHADQYIGRIDGERRFGHDRTANVHEGMEEIAKGGVRPFKGNHERIALELYVGEVQ